MGLRIEQEDFARNLDDQISVRPPWCTCDVPYWCEGKELEEKEA